MSEEKETAAAPPPKFSRYRSVRHTLQAGTETKSAVEKSAEHEIQRTKSMSRYRRSRVTPKQEQSNLPPIPQVPIPAVPAMPRANTMSTSKNPWPASPATQPTGGNKAPASEAVPVSGSSKPLVPVAEESRGGQAPPRPRETEDERLRRKVKEFQEREQLKSVGSQQKEVPNHPHPHQQQKSPTSQVQIEATSRQEEQSPPVAAQVQVDAGDKSRTAPPKPTEQQPTEARPIERTAPLTKDPESETDRARRLEGENASRLAEQKQKDLERLQRELDAAVPTPPAPTPTHTPRLQSLTSPLREKFSFFSRKKDSSKDTPPQTPKTLSGSPPAIVVKNEAPHLVERIRRAEPVKNIEPPKEDAAKRSEKLRRPLQIGQGGGGIVPQTDAPISASNAGERRVLIRCKQSSINLPITPETTPSDIIYSAANIMTQNIIPSAAILIESYTQLGLERRVRRYEHIRDIMNSWDRDTQNAFVLLNSDSPKFDTDLEVSSVPKSAPASISVQMYHSQKPGKWNKRFITLLSSGQIFMSKHSGAKPTDKDAVSLCHLSDFDIYTPTPQQLRKTLKPPKKHCYAIKSQQKTTVFLSTENFVHFFSTDDQALAEKWYFAVQNWRSWYLVNRMGEGRKKAAKPADQRPATKAGPVPPSEENPYTIGSFTPLFDTGNFGSAEEENDEHRTPRQVPFHLRNSLILSSDKRESKRHPPPVSYRLPPETEGDFSSDGLLGRTYTLRQREQKEKEAETSHSHMDGHNTQRTYSMMSSKSRHRPSTASDGVQRSSSTRSKPKPLLDFTPQFKEAPQWDKSSKGRGVIPINGLPLVEIATTPSTGLDDIPRSTVFRREATVARPGTGTSRNGQREGAFVSGGLLSGLSSPKGNGSAMNRGRMGYD